MCLYVDDYDTDGTYLGGGTRRARTPHECVECRRTIDPGETYRFWTWAYDGTVDTFKLCAHCDAVLDVGVAASGCPREWHVTMLYDRDPDIGFVANVLDPGEHTLNQTARELMELAWSNGRRGWRNADGVLLSVPQAPAEVARG